MPKQTFVCDFGNGITCTTVVNHTRIFQGKNHILDMQWSVRPTSGQMIEILPRYREWLHPINQAVVAKTNRVLLYMLQVSKTHWEAWKYAPGVSPELINVSDGR